MPCSYFWTFAQCVKRPVSSEIHAVYRMDTSRLVAIWKRVNVMSLKILKNNFVNSDSPNILLRLHKAFGPIVTCFGRCRKVKTSSIRHLHHPCTHIIVHDVEIKVFWTPLPYDHFSRIGIVFSITTT